MSGINLAADNGGLVSLTGSNQTLVVVVEETNAAQTPGSTYTIEVSGLVGGGVGPGPCERP